MTFRHLKAEPESPTSGEVKTKRGPFSERAVSVIEFRGDKIVRVSDYWNVSRILE